jgi:putative spermidine/putrescine transport system permease protein
VLRVPKLLTLFAVVILAFLTGPTLLIVPMSFSGNAFLEFPPNSWSIQWHEQYLNSSEWMSATLVSIQVALANVVVSLILGTMAAYGLQTGRFAQHNIIFALLMTPIIFPVILLAIGSFYLYSQLGMLNGKLALVLSHAALSIPVVVIFMSAAFRSYDFNQERVAASLGANRFIAFFTITLPQIKFSLFSAGLFAFLTSFDEVVISIFVAGGKATTLTKRMFNSLRDIMDPTVAAISTWVLVLTCILLLLSQIKTDKAN